LALNWLRRHQKSVFKPLAAVVVITFVFLWNVRSSNRATGRSGYKVTINGKTITPEKFASTWRMYLALNMADANNQRSNAPNEGDTFRFLVYSAMADKTYSRCSPDEVKTSIRNIVRVHLRKNQDKEITDEDYKEFLRENQFTEADFHELVNNILSVGTLEEALWTSNDFSSEELFIAYRFEKQKLTFRYKEFATKDFMSKVEEPSEENIKAFYDKTVKNDNEDNPDTLLYPSKYRIMYLMAGKEAFEKKIKLKPEDIKDYYEKIKVFRFVKDNSTAEKPEYKPLDEVKKDVEEELRISKANILAAEAIKAAKEELANAMPDLIAKVNETGEKQEKVLGKLFAETAKKHNLTFDTTGWATKKDISANTVLGKPARLTQFLKDVTWSNIIPEIRTDKGTFISSVIDVQPAKPMTLDEARAKIVTLLKMAKASELARMDATVLIDSLISRKEGFDKLDKVYSTTVRELQDKEKSMAVGDVSIEPLLLNEGMDDESFRTMQLVSRDLPARQDFENDIQFARMKTQFIQYVRGNFMAGSFRDAWWGKLKPVIEQIQIQTHTVEETD